MLAVFQTKILHMVSISVEETYIMTSCSFVDVVTLTGGHYRDIAAFPLSPLNQSNDSILSDVDVVRGL